MPEAQPAPWNRSPLHELLDAERAWLYAHANGPAMHARLLIAPAGFAAVDGWIGLHASAGDVRGALRAELTELPFVDGSCERVVLQHVLEDLAAPLALLKESLRVLRPGGKLNLFGLEPLSLWHPWLRATVARGHGWRLRLSGRLGAGLERYGFEGVRRCAIGPRWPHAQGFGRAGGAHHGLGAAFRAAYVLETTRSSSSVIPLRRSLEQPAVDVGLVPSASHRNAVAA